ncbi:MAG: prepilin peptidase [Kiritimatiellae bacterium]|nr:prepilin peptidase [Kiritimatiellia bacterium]
MIDGGYYLIGCVFSFMLGSVISSFLNVVAWRVPRGESVVSPPSHCPKCSSPIKWYQNIPIISYLALRGKCANCKERISPRYLTVEIVGALLFLAVFIRLISSEMPLATFVIYLIVMWIWVSLMIVGSLIDFDHKLLPDFVTVGGMVLGVVFSAIFTVMNFFPGAPNEELFRKFFPSLFSISGLCVGFGLLGLVRLLGSMAFKREAMGMGDVFLMGAVGAIFGPVAAIFTIVASSLFGSIVGVALVALSKTKFGRYFEIPYGPFICLGCLVWMFAGNEIVQMYLKLLTP